MQASSNRRCGICGRRLVPWRLGGLPMPRRVADRLNCGGDCWRCVDEAERRLWDNTLLDGLDDD